MTRAKQLPSSSTMSEWLRSLRPVFEADYDAGSSSKMARLQKTASDEEVSKVMQRDPSFLGKARKKKADWKISTIVNFWRQDDSESESEDGLESAASNIPDHEQIAVKSQFSPNASGTGLDLSRKRSRSDSPTSEQTKHARI